MSLTRRTCLAAGAALAAGARASASTGARTLRMSYLLPRNSQLGAGVQAMADVVESRTGGRLKIQHFPDSSLGGEVEVLKAVQLGTVDLSFTTCSPVGSILPEIGIFNIPFLFSDIAHARAVLDGPIGDSYRKMMETKNLLALAWGENGLRHLTNSKHPIVTPADLKDLKLRVPQSQVMVLGFRALGADVSTLPFPRVYEALQAGTFDAEENPIATIIAAKFAQVQKYLTLSGHVYDAAMVLMSPDVHDDLSPEDRAIIADAAKAAGAASRVFAAQAQVNGVATLRQAGMQVVEQIDRAQFAAGVAAANPDFEKLFSAQHIAEIRAAA